MADLIKTLASHMVNRKRVGREPYVLVLGAGASLSSGCSSYSELVDDFLRQKCPDDLPALNEEQDARTREEAKLERFYQEWRRMSAVNRYAFLSPHLTGTPSAGYEHLAWLVHQEYFRLLFSTNLDNQIERAFTDAGLAPNEHYEPLTNGPGKEAEIMRRLEAPTPPMKLVKLHGTLSDEDSYAWLPEEVFAFEDELDDALRTRLNKDVIILGHRMDDRDLNLPFRAKGGELWFVNPAGARDTKFKAVLGVRAQSRTLDGDSARFDEFFVALRTHIEAVESGTQAAAEEPAIHRFLREIGLPGQIDEPRSRYLHLPDLYVEPEEYDNIRAILAEHHAVVIAGDPHMGKTYTALHLLWERFQQGWNVVHMRRDALAAALQQCGHVMDEFASRHLKPKCLLHLDDPFGEIEYQALGPLQKDFSRLVREVRHRQDCGLIITSRIGIFNQAMGHLEGAALLREMGVEADIRIHTSYSQDTRRQVLERYLKLYDPPWAADEPLRESALAQVPRILEAPHNLELFARRSEGISDESELFDFAHTCREIVAALAEWMGRIAVEDQLVLVLTQSFAHRQLAELRDLHRKVLARAYEEGLVERIPSTAWDSALDRLRDIVAVENVGLWERCLSLVHPSYEEGVNGAFAKSATLWDLWLILLTAAVSHSDSRWRADAAIELASNRDPFNAECRKLLASLATDEAAGVREAVAYGLAGTGDHFDAHDRKLLASLVADDEEEVREAVADGFAGNWEALDVEDRRLLTSLAADEAEHVREAVAGGLAGNWAALDAEEARLLTSLAADEAVGVRNAVTKRLVLNWMNLDTERRKLLVSLATDEAVGVRAEMASSLAGHWTNLDSDGRKLLASLAADEVLGVRAAVASILACDWTNLDSDGRKLLACLAADEAKAVRLNLMLSLYMYKNQLDADGLKLFEQVEASLEDH